MIFFLADGQLGNQIFQYAFLKTLQKNNEKIIVCGFDDLVDVFELNDNNIINLSKKNRWIRIFMFRIIKPILTFLSNKNLISSIAVNHEKVLGNYRRETVSFRNNTGFFNKITFVKLGFFQSEKFFNREIINHLSIKNKYIQEAKEFLKPCKNKYKVFVHIRRGDYKDFTVYGKSTLLPISYYKKQIKWFLENREDCFFIFLSDEPDFIAKEFNYLDNKIISKNSYEIDFAIMTLCNGAILSPSSFGWWGSYLMKDRDVVFAPKYWLGFNSKESYHKKPLAKFMKEVEI